MPWRREIKIFDYVAKNQSGLIDAEVNYPFHEHMTECRFDKPDAYNTTLHGFKRFVGEDKLKTIVGTIGPVTVGVYASEAFRSYKEGVFYDPTCTKDDAMNHAILIVGYGTDKKLGDYWIAKNSWGTGYQDQGYIKGARNRHGNCRIGDWCAYPV